MEQMVSYKITFFQSASKSQFQKSTCYKEYNRLNDDPRGLHTRKQIPTLKIVNISQKEGAGVRYTGETIFNVQKEQMQEFYQRVNRRFRR